MFYQCVTEMRQGRWDVIGTEMRGMMTKIVDRRQQAVRVAGAAGRAAPGESAPSCSATPGAPMPARVFHLQTPCSVLEQAPLLHTLVSAVLGRASAAVATEGRALRSTLGSGGRHGDRGAAALCGPPITQLASRSAYSSWCTPGKVGFASHWCHGCAGETPIPLCGMRADRNGGSDERNF
jgi:hypothetical protein